MKFAGIRKWLAMSSVAGVLHRETDRPAWGTAENRQMLCASCA